MHITKFWGPLGAVLFLVSAAWADTLTFIPQQGPGGDFDWFNSANWFVSDATGNLSLAGRLPLADDAAVITGLVDAGAGGGIRLQNLVATNNAIIANGRFASLNVQMFSGSSFSNSLVNVLTSLTIGGTNCVLESTTLSLFATASGLWAPVAPAPSASLILARGATFQNGGVVSLTDGSLITGGAGSPSQFVILSGAALISTNQAFFQAPATNHLVLDHSGLVRDDGGTLRFGDGLDWRSSSGAGEFRAATTNALILFAAPFHADVGVVDFFTGSGTNQWLTGATMDGSAQVVGNLEVLDAVSGAGIIHVLSNGPAAGVLNWLAGAFSVPQINIDAGGEMLFSGTPGSGRVLSGCALNNSGSCVVLAGDLGFSQGATVNNFAGANFTLLADGAFTIVGTGSRGAINNAGTFQKSSSGTTQFGGLGGVDGPDFNNAGLLEVQSGQLNLLEGASSGEFRVSAGGRLWFWGGIHTLNSGALSTGDGSILLRQGTSAPTWRVNAPVGVANLEIGSNGTVDGSSNSSANSIHFGTLITSDNGTLSGGKFEAESTQMLDRSFLTNCTLNILGDLAVKGTNCALRTSVLNIVPGAAATLESLNAASTATLTLGQGSVLQDGGLVSLANGSQIQSDIPPANQLLISPGAELSSTNLGYLQGPSTNHLIIDNNGTIRAEGGVLQLGAGLDWKSSQGAGEFRAATPTALLVFGGPFHADTGVIERFTGPGTNRWTAGATLAGTAQVGAVDPVTQTPLAGNLEVMDSVSGAGSVQVFGNPGAVGHLIWMNGTLSVSQVNVNSGGTLVIAGDVGTSRHLSGCQINNSGQSLWLSGMSAGSGATWANAVGGVLDLQTDTTVAFDNLLPMLALNNAGTFVKSAGTNVTTVAADFKNTGNFEIKNGTVNFLGFWVQNVGTTVVDSGAVLGTDTVKILGGRLAGSGTVNALINNAAVVSPGSSPGILSTAPGKDYQQTSFGTLAIEIGGRTPGVQFDRLAVGGNATLAGRLQVSLSNGFTPQLGDAFEVLTCQSETGAFANIDPTGIPGTFWLPRYNGTNVVLVLAQSILLSPASVVGNTLSFSFPTVSGLTYTVQVSDTVAPAAWRTLQAITGDGSIQVVTDALSEPQRFYRVGY